MWDLFLKLVFASTINSEDIENNNFTNFKKRKEVLDNKNVLLNIFEMCVNVEK
jgi:hypothetical protein